MHLTGGRCEKSYCGRVWLVVGCTTVMSVATNDVLAVCIHIYLHGRHRFGHGVHSAEDCIYAAVLRGNGRVRRKNVQRPTDGTSRSNRLSAINHTVCVTQLSHSVPFFSNRGPSMRTQSDAVSQLHMLINQAVQRIFIIRRYIVCIFV